MTSGTPPSTPRTAGCPEQRDFLSRLRSTSVPVSAGSVFRWGPSTSQVSTGASGSSKASRPPDTNSVGLSPWTSQQVNLTMSKLEAASLPSVERQIGARLVALLEASAQEQLERLLASEMSTAPSSPGEPLSVETLTHYSQARGFRWERMPRWRTGPLRYNRTSLSWTMEYQLQPGLLCLSTDGA